MTTQDQELNWHAVGGVKEGTPYERAVLGFRNYWYPVCGGREVTEKPIRRQVLGEPLALVRRQGKVYAMVDECPHRGARMSLGKHEFPGTTTLACRFHGWTFDLTTGACVAALTDGPDSPVVGKVRLKMYPAEERKGIVWVWMGDMEPVPLEEDVPRLLLREDTLVKFRYAKVYGNWRYHAEGSAGGHFQMLHRDSIAMLFHRFFAYNKGYNPTMSDKDGDDGEYLLELTEKVVWEDDYPGLGKWPPKRPWRGLNFRRRNARLPSQGVRYIGIRLPGYLRVPHFPMVGAVYYEWYVAYDEDHYTYFQVSCHWPKNPLSRLWTHLWYHLWGAPMRKGRFNDQDKAMVRDCTDYEKRHGGNRPTKLYRPDSFPRAWIEMCNRMARGEVAQQPARRGRTSARGQAVSAGTAGEGDAND